MLDIPFFPYPIIVNENIENTNRIIIKKKKLTGKRKLKNNLIILKK